MGDGGQAFGCSPLLCGRAERWTQNSFPPRAEQDRPQVVYTEVSFRPTTREPPEKGTVPPSPLWAPPHALPLRSGPREPSLGAKPGLTGLSPWTLSRDREGVGTRLYTTAGRLPCAPLCSFSTGRNNSRQIRVLGHSTTCWPSCSTTPSLPGGFPEGLPQAGILELESPPRAWGGPWAKDWHQAT